MVGWAIVHSAMGCGLVSLWMVSMSRRNCAAFWLVSRVLAWRSAMAATMAAYMSSGWCLRAIFADPSRYPVKNLVR